MRIPSLSPGLIDLGLQLAERAVRWYIDRPPLGRSPFNCRATALQPDEAEAFLKARRDAIPATALVWLLRANGRDAEADALADTAARLRARHSGHEIVFTDFTTA